MKRKSFGLLIITAAFFSVLFACKAPFFDSPFLPSRYEGGGDQSGIPNGLSASHGEKRAIGLSWNEDSSASFYYIYRADSPLNTFIRCGETSSAQIKFNVPSGSTMYYRISSVSYDGIESPLSGYVRGTSLAQPVISDITDVDEAGAAVTWYMDNVYEETYKNSLLYTVYCFSGTTEVAQVAVDGALLNENKVFVSGLNANTRYEYQVEAYLRSDQSASEKSDKMDAATARRLRPGAPLKPWADRGRAKNSVMLSFELPELVDIALGDNKYEPKPIYFKISKRQYSETHSNEFVEVCSYLGSIGEKAASAFNGQTFDGYEPGKWVSWNDTGAGVRRGVKYEYQIQSYVDDTTKVISSDTSKASAVGWALSDGTLSFGRLSYKLNDDEDKDEYVSAKLPLDFEFDPMGESYTYVLHETIEVIDEENPTSNDPDSTIKGYVTFTTYNAIRAYTPEMDLTRKTTEHNRGRGTYSYEVEIRLGDDDLDKFATIGRIEISEETQPVIVEEFHVQDGYADKFVFKWPRHSNRKYDLYESIDGKTWDNIIASIYPDSTDDDATLDENYLYTVDRSSGISRFFAIRPGRDKGDGSFKPGQFVYFPTVSMTLGVPELEQITGHSYSTINAVWSETQKADTYRIMYKYTEESNWQIAGTAAKENISIDINGHYKFPFKPEGYNDVTKSGKEIQIQVVALNEGLRASVGGAEISTSSTEDVKTKLVGPALLDLQASRAASAEEIDILWNKVSGAGGYYVFRRQFNMNNSAEEGNEYVVYYIPAEETSSIIIKGKSLALDSSNAKIDTETVKAEASFADSKYTLKDKIMTDEEYGVPLATGGIYNRHTVGYKNQQNDMMQGYPYRYYVVPVLLNESLSSIEFVYAKDGSNRNTDIASYTIRENGANIQFTGASALEREGFAIGFGYNVTATKGTYKSNPAVNENNGIRITWSAPPRIASVDGFIPRYTVYRRITGGQWVTITNITESEYIDTIPGIAYEYAIGIAKESLGGGSNPTVSQRFIEHCNTLLDDRNRPNMLGYMLNMVEMREVSRNEQKVGNDFAEDVGWRSAGIQYLGGEDNNWGIDGYTVFVMNRNIDSGWHPIADVSSFPNQIDLNVKVTNVQGGATLESGLLKVLRDYKHFFKVRSYVLNSSNEKVYSLDPEYDYELKYRTNRENLETDNVKWGARQIDATEFARIATLAIQWGIAGINGSGWTTAYTGTPNFRKSYEPGGNDKNVGASGRVSAASSYGIGAWWFDFDKYKPAFDTKANKSNDTYKVTFVTIDTGGYASYNFNTENLEARKKSIFAESGGSGAWPNWYGALPGFRSSDYGTEFFDVLGPDDTPGLYTGKMKFDGNLESGISIAYTNTLLVPVSASSSGTRKFKWGNGANDGWIAVQYPVGADTQQVKGGQINTPLIFSNQTSGAPYRQDEDAWY